MGGLGGIGIGQRVLFVLIIRTRILSVTHNLINKPNLLRHCYGVNIVIRFPSRLNDLESNRMQVDE